MLSGMCPTITKTTRMGRGRNNRRNERGEHGTRNTKPPKAHRKGNTPTRRRTEREYKKILNGIKYNWGEMSCPEEAYQLIMEKRRRTAP